VNAGLLLFPSSYIIEVSNISTKHLYGVKLLLGLDRGLYMCFKVEQFRRIGYIFKLMRTFHSVHLVLVYT